MTGKVLGLSQADAEARLQQLQAFRDETATVEQIRAIAAELRAIKARVDGLVDREQQEYLTSRLSFVSSDLRYAIADAEIAIKCVCAVCAAKDEPAF